MREILCRLPNFHRIPSTNNVLPSPLWTKSSPTKVTYTHLGKGKGVGKRAGKRSELKARA